MKFPNNIKREHILKAIERIDKGDIPENSTSKYYDLVFNSKFYSPKLVVSFANSYINGVDLDRNSFDGGPGKPAFKLLEKEGFEIIEKIKIPKVKLYDFHGESALKNAERLLSSNHEWFYWDDANFKKYAKGDVVFWINRSSKKALYTIVDETTINPVFEDGKNYIRENGIEVYAYAQTADSYENFFRFKVLQIIDIPLDWNYADPKVFQNQIMSFILFEINVNEIEKRISKIDDLLKLFSSGAANSVLINAKELLIDNNIFMESASKSPRDYSLIKSKFKIYLLEIFKLETEKTAIDYIKWLDKVNKWFIDNKVVKNTYIIWDIDNDNAQIDLLLNTTYKGKWDEFKKLQHNWNSSSWNSWNSFLAWINSKTENDMSNLSSEFITDLKNSGINFSEKLITRFIASLCTKQFLILTGLSGSGKTKLAQAFANWIGESKEQYLLVPVGADWTNREPLLGYPNSLEPQKYVTPESGVIQIIKKSIENPQKPYFLILDEMNLSHVERYFADFLSAMESKESIKLYSDSIRYSK